MVRWLPLILACCGLWAAPSLAAKRPIITDRVTAVDGTVLTFANQDARAILANIIFPANVTPHLPRVGSYWEIKNRGTDRYGRTLVVLTPPGQKITYQETLLQAGQAIAYNAGSYPKMKKYAEAEAEARDAHRGLWAQERLFTPAHAADHLQQFALVEGNVTRTYQARDAYYINFGKDWKTDFSITIPRKAWRSFKDDLEVAPGQRLRVRGAIISENGPMVVVTRPEQLEKL